MAAEKAPQTPGQIGVVGMGVMGANIALNFADHGFRVRVWDRHIERIDEMHAKHGHPDVWGTASLESFVSSLERPRRILLMITAGAPIDELLARLSPLLSPGDIVIDGGNSWFLDTQRREEALSQLGFLFVGMGVSGGEEGARRGPSLMPGGPAKAYEELRPMLEAIAARSPEGPCVTHVGRGGSGHFVKMVHNGIEYADMQLLAETYDVLRRALGLSTDQIADLFSEWNKGIAESFLLETTITVLRKKEPETHRPLVDLILDKAGQKGTGKWTVQVALDLGVPVPSIAAALDARTLSSLKEERIVASAKLPGPKGESLTAEEKANLATWMHDALYAARVCTYGQGMRLIQAASNHHGWNVSLAEMARIWRAGCIIRARLLSPLRAAFQKQPLLSNVIISDDFAPVLAKMAPGWRRAVATATRLGIPMPVFSSTLAYLDSYRSEELPANLIQAMRDLFGAHTYQLRADPEGPFVHTDWSV